MNNGTATTSDGATSTPIEAALKEADRVIKRQKTCAAKTSGTLYKIIQSVEKSIKDLSEDATLDPAAVIDELSKTLDALDAVSVMSADTKELHGAVGKLGKIVDIDFDTDICASLRQIPMDRGILDKIIAEHLYHEGAFTVADAFVLEAGIEHGDKLKAPFASMHAVLEEIQKRNLGPALEWAEKHRKALRKAGGGGGGDSVAALNVAGSTPGEGVEKGTKNCEEEYPSAFEFSLHRLAFLQTLEREGQQRALTYARLHFPMFKTTHMKEIQRLMGLLCFSKRLKAHAAAQDTKAEVLSKNNKLYADLFSDSLWEALAVEFRRRSCFLIGQAQDSPLLVTISAGAAALPTLLKLASVVSKTQPAVDLAEQNNELPVEVPLGKEFVFNSIFACPVSREQSSAENPPMMLPCGHCLSKQSVLRVAKSITRAFKCPYCPKEATLQQCMELKFPDMKE
ncbi:hypothetical protein Ndes2526B_g04372 [Nannochloris sp. 'desiccata']